MENQRTFRFAIAAMCVVYVAARLWHLTDSCTWFDEIFSVHAAEQSWSGMWSFIAQDLIHPPLFYALLKLWIGIGGDGLLWLRMFPVLFAVLALIPFIHLGHELKLSRGTIVIAVGLFAVNGALIKYSQTLRMYSLLMFLSLMSIWLFARYFNRGKGWIWLIVVNALLVNTHYFGWLVVGGELLTILLFQRIKIGRASVMVATTALAFLPWLFTVLNRERLGPDLDQNIAWQPRPGGGELVKFLLSLVEPFYTPASSLDQSSVRIIAVPLLLTIAVAIGFFFSTDKAEEEKTFARFGVVFTVFPLFVAFTLSWLLPNSVWGVRHLIVVTPIFLLLGAAGLMSLKDSRLIVGTISVVAALTVAAFVVKLKRPSTEQVWCAWQNVENEIRSAESASTEPPTIYTFEGLAAYHLWFAGRKADRPRIAIVRGVPVRTNDQAYFLPRGFSDVSTVNVDEINDSQLWLAFRVFRLGEEFPLIEAFTSRGYRVCYTYQNAYGTNRVFRVKFAKHSAGCSAP